MIHCLLTQLSKQTDFIQQQHYELQREILIDRNNTQYKNICQSDTKKANIGQSVEQIALLKTLFYNVKQLKLIIRPTLKQRIIIVVSRKVTTQVHRLFQRKRILLSLVII